MTARVQAFFTGNVFGALLLMFCAVVALAWANSPWSESYFHLIHVPISIHVGALPPFERSLQHWVNDGLMAVFFFVVGLEIKRELLVGSLSSFRRASLPVIAALGGMVVPAGLYLLVAPDPAIASGCGVPVATDIAFALGVLHLLGQRASAGMLVLLTAIAVADDLGAIFVIGVFYTEDLHLPSLFVGLGAYACAIGLNFAKVRHPAPYLFIALIVWFQFLGSGVHGTLAAVLMAWTIPARAKMDGTDFVSHTRQLLDELPKVGLPRAGQPLRKEQHDLLEHSMLDFLRATTPLQRLEHLLLPWANFLVLPLFALANAGVQFEGGFMRYLEEPVTWGIAVGLVLGKPIGIVGASWLAVLVRVAELPPGMRWIHMLGIGLLGGVGFTMSIFIASLAFSEPAYQESAKIGIFLGSGIAGIFGWMFIYRAASSSSMDTSAGSNAETVSGVSKG